MKKVLVISRYEIVLASVLNRFYENGFDALGALRNAEALSFLKSFKPDFVVLSGAFELAEQEDLTAELIDYQPNLTIIVHRSGVNELMQKVDNLYH